MIEVLRLLHEIEQGSARYSTSYYVRSLDKNENIPQFGHGIPDSLLCQREWIWIAYSSKDDSPLAMIAAAPIQNIAMLVRAYAIPSVRTQVMLGLLRKSLADILARGYTQYAIFLDKSRTSEAKLLRIATRAGAKQVGGNHIMVSGPTNIGRL